MLGLLSLVIVGHTPIESAGGGAVAPETIA
jgi:hypothetical protein